MKELILFFLSFNFFLNSLSYCTAQVKSVEYSVNQSVSEKLSPLGQIGINYVNDWVYMGRKDSLSSRYFMPYFEYNHPSGVFLNTSLSYLATKESNRVDLTSITLGYDYISWRLSTGISTSGYFYNKESYNVQSEMIRYTSAYLGYDFYLIETQLSTAIGLSKGADAFLSIDIFRSFYPSTRWEIRPLYIVNWGTQRYYNEYYRFSSSSHGLNKRRGQMRRGSVVQNSNVTIEEETKFQLLDHEFSLISAYRLGKFRFVLAGTYAIPVNPAQVTTDQLVFEENLKNTFYWSTGISYQIFNHTRNSFKEEKARK